MLIWSSGLIYLWGCREKVGQLSRISWVAFGHIWKSEIGWVFAGGEQNIATKSGVFVPIESTSEWCIGIVPESGYGGWEHLEFVEEYDGIGKIRKWVQKSESIINDWGERQRN